MPSGAVRAGPWWCAASRVWARPCSWITWPEGRECRVARAVSVQTEMELAFAGLHQLCAPMLGGAEHLPGPQRDALRTAFGLAAGPPPDRFLVGLATLSLLSEVAGERPLICLVDDEQWLDQASAQALGFAARRLAAEPVGLVFAAREPGAELAGLPELEVVGLRESDARALLDSALAEPLDDLARDTYLTAWIAATYAGRLAGAGHLQEVCRAAQALPPPEPPPGPLDLLLEGLALLGTDGPAAAASALRRAVRAFASEDIPMEDRLQFGPMAQGAAIALWDEDGQRAILVRQVALARTVGALDQLPIDLVALAIDDAWRGDFAGAASLIADCDAVCEVTGGSRVSPIAAMFLGALRGNQAEVIPLIEGALAAAEAAGQGGAVTGAHWASSVLHNGLGRYADALAAAQEATRDASVYVSILDVPELVEAAARAGNADVAADALQRLAETTRPSGNDLALGIEARSRALVSDGETAERLYQEAIERLGRTQLRPDLARAHLLYGEWLRGRGRRGDAREQLRTAYGMLAAIGMEAFAERARRGLIATGETVRKRTVETSDQLTAQETLIARLARDGLSNPEIAAQLFLSARTIEWHLRKIFTKLDIGSRRELREALPAVPHGPRT